MPHVRQVGSAAMAPRRHGRSRPGKPTHITLLLSTAMLLLGVLLYLWPQMRLVNLGYRQARLQTQRAQILRRQKALRVELASLRQLSRIEAIAVQRLHMRPPQMSQIIYVHAEQGVMAPGRDR